MNDDAEDFIGGLIGSSTPQTSQGHNEYTDESNSASTIGASEAKPSSKKTNSKKWVKPVIICVGVIAVGVLTVLSTNDKQLVSPPQQTQPQQVQVKAIEDQQVVSVPAADFGSVASSLPENQENTMLGANNPQQPAVAHTGSQSVENAGSQDNSSSPARGEAVNPSIGKNGSVSAQATALKEKDEIIADMKASMQSKDRDIEGLMKEIEILKQQKRVAKIAVKDSEPKATVTTEVRKQVSNSNKLVVSTPKQKLLSRKDAVDQTAQERSFVERIDESRRSSTPESLRILGVTMREGMEMAIVEISGDKKRIFVGDVIPGLGKVSEITKTPSIVINGITYK